MQVNTLSVRALADFVFRSGDLYPPFQGPRVEAIEGVETQQKLQQLRSENDRIRGRGFGKAFGNPAQ